MTLSLDSHAIHGTGLLTDSGHLSPCLPLRPFLFLACVRHPVCLYRLLTDKRGTGAVSPASDGQGTGLETGEGAFVAPDEEASWLQGALGPKPEGGVKGSLYASALHPCPFLLDLP